MTFEQCDAVLSAIRRRQGTTNPKVRVDFGTQAVAGRIARSDSDPDRGRLVQGPYGVLVLESLGLCRLPQTYVQIANIPDDGIQPIDE
jgi:hypothetical protein